jgi:hypothetical protein
LCFRLIAQVTSTLIPDRIARQFGLRRGFKEFVGTVAFLGAAFAYQLRSAQRCRIVSEAWHVFIVE